jgi:hypothetical protein
MDSQITYVLSVRGHTLDRNKNKSQVGDLNLEVDLNLQKNP